IGSCPVAQNSSQAPAPLQAEGMVMGSHPGDPGTSETSSEWSHIPESQSEMN
ncbi:Hypothetical predicted protein, partial [Marmota monax]